MTFDTSEFHHNPIDELRAMAQEYKNLKVNIQEQEHNLSELKQRKEKLETEIIPDLLQSNGLDKVTLGDGSTISLGKFYYGSIPESRKDEAFDFLRSIGADGIIKKEIVLDCPKTISQEEYERIQERMEEYSRLGVNIKFKEGVHPQTLRSFIREQIEEEEKSPEPFPRELFGAVEGYRANLNLKS